jgi:hypothetical protein
MEPIEASASNSSALNENPFEDAATTFIFGSGNTAADTAEQGNEQTPTATAATAQGAGSSAAAAGAPGASAVATGAKTGTSSILGTSASGTSPLLLILLFAGGAFAFVHFVLHK